MLELHRFMVAVSQVSANHDGRGGSAPDPLVWDLGSRSKRRGFDIRVNVDLAMLPGPLVFLNGPCVQVQGGCISGVHAAVQVLCFLEFLALSCWC